MRIRYKPYARSELAAWSQFIENPAQHKGRWADFFANPLSPLHLELGCGKGGFLATHALAHPAHNYIGIDLKSEVLVVAKRTIKQLFAEKEKNPDNIALLSQDIERIGNIFSPEDTFSRIYINFCNPWCKTGHAKHRLTHPRQLLQYRAFLLADGEIWFKTDEDSLFEDSLRYFSAAGFEVLWATQNLHQENPDWNFWTEHEMRFATLGVPIKACIARVKPAMIDKSAVFRLKNM